ncbi:hypothetical protein PHYC_00308 [Phycisphaerales bacterium]|nr:hypothetical protein PHYC_00308 [Phycisphaerales bacterium]
MFTTDRDLLVFEPHLFRDLAWAGQTLISGTANYAGSVLELTGDQSLEDQSVAAGHVITVDGVSYEIMEVLGATELWVSVVRASHDDPVIPAVKMIDRPAYVSTFAPQIAIAHRQVLRLVGVEPDLVLPGQPTEASIKNPRELARLEALAALHLIYSAAAAASGQDSPLAQRAAMYLERFRAESTRVAALLDLNNDGIPDSTRRPCATYLTRT